MRGRIDGRKKSGVRDMAAEVITLISGGCGLYKLIVLRTPWYVAKKPPNRAPYFSTFAVATAFLAVIDFGSRRISTVPNAIPVMDPHC